MIKSIKLAFLAATVLVSATANAAEYRVDDKGAHASIEFKIKHLGYSWLTGRFNTFGGTFTYNDETKDMASIVAKVDIDPSSIDSNHAERDVHLRGKKFLDVESFPKSGFVTSGYKAIDRDSGTLTGNLTLHGVTKSIDLDVKRVGEGNDPWGGYRAGFVGTTTLKLKDFDINYDLGPASTEVYMTLSVEGIRQ